MRFVLDPDRVLTPDLRQNLPGRGLYIRPDRALIEQAIQKRLFARSAKGVVHVPDAFLDRLEQLYKSSLLNLLGLAKKSGQLISGLDKIRDCCSSNQVSTSKRPPAYLLEARDGGEDGRKRAIKLVGDLPVLYALTASEQGQALGRDNAVHIILSEGKLSRRIVQMTKTLAGLEAQD